MTVHRECRKRSMYSLKALLAWPKLLMKLDLAQSQMHFDSGFLNLDPMLHILPTEIEVSKSTLVVGFLIEL